MARDQVLVVEDNARNMTLLRDVLQATGYRTLPATTGRQALALATRHRPGLVLMDIRLPDMDGTEALRLLRTEARTGSIPVLAVTAQAMKGDRERFLEAGFDGYLSKPIDVDALLAAVRAFTGGTRDGHEPALEKGPNS
jgi:two-component system cell cycle response regulator DivK